MFRFTLLSLLYMHH